VLLAPHPHLAVPGPCCASAPDSHGLCACFYEAPSCEQLLLIAEMCCLHGGWDTGGCFQGSRSFALCCGETLGRWGGSTFSLTPLDVLEVTVLTQDAPLQEDRQPELAVVLELELILAWWPRLAALVVDGAALWVWWAR